MEKTSIDEFGWGAPIPKGIPPFSWPWGPAPASDGGGVF